jgi:actin-related protein
MSEKSKQNQKKEKYSEDKRMKIRLTEKMKEMETDFDNNEHVVIDMGNAITKIGFSGEDLPTLEIPSIMARNKLLESDKKVEISSYDQKMDVFGYEALDEQYKADYNIHFLTPGDHKEKTSKEFLDLLKDALENKLGISPTDYDVIVNMSPIRNDENIRTFGRLFIEELGFKAIAIINSSSLELYATGRTSGLVVECGETRTYTVPIFEGFPLYHALSKNKLGGRDLTEIFKEGIIENNLNIKSDDIFTLRNIKEKTCCVPVENDYKFYLDENNKDIIPQEKVLYKLPDETIITIPRKSRILASELLFNPSCVQKEDIGLKNLIINSIKKSEIINESFKEILLNNIVLSGGTTMIPNFAERIKKDLLEYKDNETEWSIDYRPEVIAENNRNIGKWIGMSMIASMSAFEKMFIKKLDYQEKGEENFAEIAQIF